MNKVVLAAVAACLVACGGCKTLELLGVGGVDEDVIVSIAETAILAAAEKHGVTLTKDQIKAFTALVQARPEIDDLVAEVVQQNAEHAALQELSEELADVFLGE